MAGGVMADKGIGDRSRLARSSGRAPGIWRRSPRSRSIPKIFVSVHHLIVFVYIVTIYQYHDRHVGLL